MKISNREYDDFIKSCIKDKISISEKLREIIKNQTQIRSARKIPKGSEFYQTSDNGKTFEALFLL